MTVRVSQYNEEFKTYYEKRRKDGSPYKKAMIATVHKLIRIIFAMLSNNTYFIAGTN